MRGAQIRLGTSDWSNIEKVRKKITMKNLKNNFPSWILVLHQKLTIQRTNQHCPSCVPSCGKLILRAARNACVSLAFAENPSVRSPCSSSGPNHPNQPAQLVHGLPQQPSSTSGCASLAFGGHFQAKHPSRAS